MKIYSHTQSMGRWLLIPAGISLLFLMVAAATGAWAFLAGVTVLALVAWLFGSLTVEVADGELRWRFGPGLIRRRLALADIAEAWPVTTTWVDGWGIHHTRHGWLHNVAGFRAVALRLKNGRRLALGTDDPERLLAALGQPQASPHAN